MKKILLTTFILILAMSIKAQPTYRHTYYDDHNGMSHWHLTRMVQDSRGFMWFSSWNGLNRYDGYDFAVFKSMPGDGNNLVSDRIRDMILGDDGHIYCVINDVIWRFNLTTYRFENVDAVTQERYLARIKSEAHKHTSPGTMECGGYTFNNVKQVFRDSQKNYWLMCKYGVDKVFPAPQPVQFVEHVPRSTVRTVYKDRKNRIWVGTRDSNHVLLLDSLANLIGFLGRDGRLHHEPVEFDAAYCVYQQKDGTIWLGTKPNGIYRLHEQADGSYQLHHFTMGSPAQIKAGLTPNSNDIYDFKEDSKGRLWIATQGGGLNIMDNPLSDSPRFHNASNDMAQHIKSGNMLMRRLLFAGDSLCLATSTDGLFVIDNINGNPKNMTFTVHQRDSKRKESLSNSATMDILFDRKGRLFIATESGGVNMILTDNLRSKEFDFKHFDTTNGMGSDVALAMTEVGDEILIQCNNQITRLNADLNKTENFNDLFFSITARFSDSEPILIADGRWLLTLEDGIITIPEEMFHQRQYIPRLLLTAYNTPGKPADYTVESKDTIVLEYPERDITLSYAAIDYTNNSDIKYVTRISESDIMWQSDKEGEWSAPQDNRTLNLHNLSPGTYTLEIRSTNAEGLWVDNTRKVTIIVKPVFWETTIAYILYVILFVLLISGITYTVTYIRNLRKQREENLQAYLKVLNSSAAAHDEKETNTVAEKIDLADTETATDTETLTSNVISHSDSAPLVASPIINEEDDAFMRRLLEFVEKNLGNSEVGVEEMASATATSRSSLNRKMKHLLGITPADFLKEARMKRAQQLLITTSRGVTDIAYSCGFSDPKYFSKCFKASTELSPSEYRASHQQQ